MHGQPKGCDIPVPHITSGHDKGRDSLSVRVLCSLDHMGVRLTVNRCSMECVEIPLTLGHQMANGGHVAQSSIDVKDSGFALNRDPLSSEIESMRQ
jgi:hypothetical protein